MACSSAPRPPIRPGTAPCDTILAGTDTTVITVPAGASANNRVGVENRVTVSEKLSMNTRVGAIVRSGWVGPSSAPEAAMPAQDRVGADQGMATQRSGQPPEKSGEHGLICSVHAWSWVGA